MRPSISFSRRWIERLGSLPHEPDPEDLILDWDGVQLERNVALIEQKQFRSVT